VVQAFAECKAQERKELLSIFHALSKNPFQQGDYVQQTASLRTLQMKRFGKWLITYWPSHAEVELWIVDVKRLVP
jgi:hypothetical protein